MFFTIYVKMDRVSLSPAWIEGRAVAAVFEDRADPKPSYVMWLAWRQRPLYRSNSGPKRHGERLLAPTRPQQRGTSPEAAMAVKARMSV